MKCSVCGTDFSNDSVFCPKCGERGIESPSDSGLAIDPPGVIEDDDSLQPPAPQAKTPPEQGEVSKPQAPKTTDSGSQPTMSERLMKMANEHEGDDKNNRPALGWTEGGYAGKAMRAKFILALLFTIPFLALGIWLHTSNHMPEGSTLRYIIWGSLLILPVLLWCYLWSIYLYRTWTIRYRLTDFRFYHEEGFFIRVKDIVEVIDIDDIKLEQSLVDRFINGGVGTIVIESNDATHPKLVLVGLDTPEAAFDAIDESRRRQRVERGLKSI